MKKKLKPILLYTMAITKISKSCYWCGQPLQKCAACNGSGTINDSFCWPCKGNGRLCPTHEGNWAG